MRPRRVLNKVVLPDPFDPIISILWPGKTSKLTSSKIALSERTHDKFSTFKLGSIDMSYFTKKNRHN